MLETIQEQLENLEQEHNVEILYACESGSRAWGLESPDSDYDVRFIYRHNTDWYLSLTEQRGMLGPLYTDMDINLDFVGWDIRKTLRLLRKSNPQLLEWLTSPVVYDTHKYTTTSPGQEEFQSSIVDAIKTYYSPVRAAHYYHKMARRNYNEYLKNDQVSVKKYLYVIRPLLAARYVRRGQGFPPVNFMELLKAERPDSGDLVTALMRSLVSAKKNGTKTVERLPTLNTWIERELEQGNPDDFPLVSLPDSLDDLNTLFRRLVKQT